MRSAPERPHAVAADAIPHPPAQDKAHESDRSLDLPASLRAAYDADLDPHALIDMVSIASLRRNRPGIFISLRPRNEVHADVALGWLPTGNRRTGGAPSQRKAQYRHGRAADDGGVPGFLRRPKMRLRRASCAAPASLLIGDQPETWICPLPGLLDCGRCHPPPG